MMLDIYQTTPAQLCAEMERLRAKNATIEEVRGDLEAENKRLCVVNERLRAQNAELLAALHEARHIVEATGTKRALDRVNDLVAKAGKP
jgi:hypothetical protein